MEQKKKKKIVVYWRKSSPFCIESIEEKYENCMFSKEE